MPGYGQGQPRDDITRALMRVATPPPAPQFGQMPPPAQIAAPGMSQGAPQMGAPAPMSMPPPMGGGMPPTAQGMPQGMPGGMPPAAQGAPGMGVAPPMGGTPPVGGMTQAPPMQPSTMPRY